MRQLSSTTVAHVRRARRMDRDRQASGAHLAAAAAAEPQPRDRLREALARRAEANAALKLERALLVARSAQAEAQTRHDAATEAAEAANGGAAELLAASFFTGTKPNGSAPSPAAARAELAAATDALVVAKKARTILDSKLKDARSAMGFANPPSGILPNVGKYLRCRRRRGANSCVV